MLDEKIPALFAHTSCRIFQNCFKRHFPNILPMYMPDFKKPLKFDKALTFFEYVGNNAETVTLLNRILEGVDCNDIFLVIDDCYEGLLTKTVLEKIKTLLETHPKVTNFRIFSSNLNLKSDIIEVFGNSDSFYYFNIHLHIPEYDNVIPYRHQFEINNKLRTKKFLCVNRQERYHRLITVDHLIKKNYLKDGYVSCMLGEYEQVLFDTDKKTRYNPKLETYQDPKLFNIELPYEQKNRLVASLPLELDVRQEQYHQKANHMPLLDDYFNDSYFTIITEGDFWSDSGKRQFTEKVLKSFLCYHPFVVIGLPYTLRLLRDHGFITFSHIIDESYDEVEDDIKRHAMAMEQVDKLLAMNIHELKQTYEKIIPILEHNRQMVIQTNKTPVPSRLVSDISQWYLY